MTLWLPPPTVAEWISAALTAGLLIVAFLQWRTYRQQATHMLDGLLETRRSVDAALKSAELAERALIFTERAYLHAVNWSVTNLEDGKRPRVRSLEVGTHSLALNGLLPDLGQDFNRACSADCPERESRHLAVLNMQVSI